MAEIIQLKRGEGKTYKLLKMSEKLSLPILCYSESQRKFLNNKALKEGISIENPIVYKKGLSFNGEVLIDEIHMTALTILGDQLKESKIQCTDDIVFLLEEEIGTKIYACTFTSLRDEREK